MSPVRDPLFAADFLVGGVKFSCGFSVIEVVDSDCNVIIWSLLLFIQWMRRSGFQRD